MKIPSSLYARIPQVWFLLGLLFIANGLYIGIDFAASIGYIGIGLVCCAYGIGVAVVRSRYRRDNAAQEQSESDDS